MSRTMKDSGIPWIGEIPSHWKLMPHKWVMHKEKEIREKYHGETILSLTMKGVIVRDLDAGGKMPSSFDGYQAVYPNDLLQCLFDIDVTPRCVGLVKNEGLVSPAYSRFVLHSNGYTPYYDYLLRYMDDNKVLLHLSKNLRSSLTETDFGAINTCVPPIPEQQAIADFLDKKCGEIDEMVSLQEKIVEELLAYKYALIGEVTTKGLNEGVELIESGIDWIGDMPSHWRLTTFKEYGIESEERNKGNKTTELLALSYSLGVTLYKDKIYNKDRVKNDYEEYKIVLKDDLVLSPNDIIKGSVFVSKYNGCISPMYLIFHPRNPQTHNLRYLSYLLRNKSVGRKFFFMARGLIGEILDNGKYVTRRMTVAKNDITGFIVLLPPPLEQNKIVDYLDAKCSEIDSLISLKQSKIDALKEYKKSVIYEYITGKKEVI